MVKRCPILACKITECLRECWKDVVDFGIVGGSERLFRCIPDRSRESDRLFRSLQKRLGRYVFLFLSRGRSGGTRAWREKKRDRYGDRWKDQEVLNML